jgi:hypothetical protein
MGARNVHNLDIGQLPSDSLYGYGPESLLSGYKSNRFSWLAKSSKSSWESGG